jgi:hypothetical protein
MKKIKLIYRKTKSTFQKWYRLLNVKKSILFIWKELFSIRIKTGWIFGPFDTDRPIECCFTYDKEKAIHFYYNLTPNRLNFTGVVLSSFKKEHTNDLLVLASHFNSFSNLGVVKVNLENNYVEMEYDGETFNYSIFPGEIDSDMTAHYEMVRDCFWSYDNLLETGEDPKFVISELMKRREENSKKRKLG